MTISNANAKGSCCSLYCTFISTIRRISKCGAVSREWQKQCRNNVTLLRGVAGTKAANPEQRDVWSGTAIPDVLPSSTLSHFLPLMVKLRHPYCADDFLPRRPIVLALQPLMCIMGLSGCFVWVAIFNFIVLMVNPVDCLCFLQQETSRT